MRFTGKLAIATAAVALVAAVPASAHTLNYSTAKRLANELGAQHEAESGNVVDWRIFSPQRQGPHRVVFLYNVEYDNGRVCDAEIVVKFRSSSSRRVLAGFRDTVCDGP
jgi:hypothetical protein